MKKISRHSGADPTVSVYIDGAFEHLYQVDPSSGVRSYEHNEIHVMDDRIRIAQIRTGTPFPSDSSPAVRYFLEDHLGNSSFTLSNTGTIISREEYFPFGETSFGSFAKKRYRFCGKERDEESGLYYYGARYYAAWTCRFVSVDPFAGNLIEDSPYSYAGNSPIILIDPDGLAPEEIPDTSSTKGKSYATKIEVSNLESSNPLKLENIHEVKKLDEPHLIENEKRNDLPNNHIIENETQIQSNDGSHPPQKKIWLWFKSLFEKCRAAMKKQPSKMRPIKLIEVRSKTKTRIRNADPINIPETWNTPLNLNLDVGNANQLKVKFNDRQYRDLLLIEDNSSQENNTNVNTNDDLYSSNQGPDRLSNPRQQTASVAIPQGQIRTRVLPNINKNNKDTVYYLSLRWQIREQRRITKTYLFGFLPLLWKTRRTSWVPSTRNLN